VQTLATQVDTSEAAQKALAQASKGAVRGLHKKLAVDISEKNDAKSALNKAEGQIEAAKKAQIEAENPASREKAKVFLVTAQAAAKHAKTSLRVAETNSDAAVKVAGMKRKNAAISVANADAAVMSIKGRAAGATIKAKQADANAARVQDAATKLALKGSKQARTLDRLRAKERKAKREFAEARRLTSPTVAKEVATKKAIAVVSTEFVKRQAAAKALSLAKQKKAATEELKIIEVVAAKIKAKAGKKP